jgi:hypothetical protein
LKTNNEEDKEKDMNTKIVDPKKNFLSNSIKNVEG